MRLLFAAVALLLGSVSGGYVPIGDGGGKKQTCPESWSITGVDEWIQGETTLDAGALTMVFFFSQRYAPLALSRTRCGLHQSGPVYAPLAPVRRPPHAAVLIDRCSCHICHDVAPNLQKMYKKLRSRGLQIVAVHSTPKGYKAKDKDVAALKEWVDEAGLEFSIVDTHVSQDTSLSLPQGCFMCQALVFVTPFRHCTVIVGSRKRVSSRRILTALPTT